MAKFLFPGLGQWNGDVPNFWLVEFRVSGLLYLQNAVKQNQRFHIALARKCMDFRGTHQKIRTLGDTGFPKRDCGLARLE